MSPSVTFPLVPPMAVPNLVMIYQPMQSSERASKKEFKANLLPEDEVII